jgi:hypothetical protein
MPVLVKPARLAPLRVTYKPSIGGYEAMVHSTLGTAGDPADGFEAAMAPILAAMALFPAQAAETDRLLLDLAGSQPSNADDDPSIDPLIPVAQSVFAALGRDTTATAAGWVPALGALSAAISAVTKQVSSFRPAPPPAALAIPAPPGEAPAPPPPQPPATPSPKPAPKPPIVVVGPPVIIGFPGSPCDPFVDPVCDPFTGQDPAYGGPGFGGLPYYPPIEQG